MKNLAINSFTQSVSVTTIAEKLSAEVHGDQQRILSNIRPLDVATTSDLSFFSPSTKRGSSILYRQALQTQAGALLVPEFNPEFPTTQIITAEPMKALIDLVPLFFPPLTSQAGIHPQAVIGENVTIDPSAQISAFAVIGSHVTIGPRTVIHPHVVIYPQVSIGADCIIHAGAIIREYAVLGNDCQVQSGVVVGGDGFGYLPDAQLGLRRIPHVGRVILGDRVDLGANSTIDRATFGETTVGSGTKIDNLVMIGHNGTIGENNIFCSQVGISGSVNIGDQCVFAGQVGVADHIRIGSKVRIAAQSGVTGNLESNQDVGGFPSRPIQRFRRETASISQLPELLKRVSELEKRLGMKNDK